MWWRMSHPVRASDQCTTRSALPACRLELEHQVYCLSNEVCCRRGVPAASEVLFRDAGNRVRLIFSHLAQLYCQSVWVYGPPVHYVVLIVVNVVCSKKTCDKSFFIFKLFGVFLFSPIVLFYSSSMPTVNGTNLEDEGAESDGSLTWEDFFGELFKKENNNNNL